MNYEKKEYKILEKIAKTLEKLDVTLGKMEDTDSKVKHFFEQEKAIHEIRTIIREANKFDKTEDKAAVKAAERIISDENNEMKILEKIDNRFVKLNETIDKLDNSELKIKEFIEQKKAIHEVKRILHDVGKFEKYEENELDNLTHV